MRYASSPLSAEETGSVKLKNIVQGPTAREWQSPGSVPRLSEAQVQDSPYDSQLSKVIQLLHEWSQKQKYPYFLRLLFQWLNRVHHYVFHILSYLLPHSAIVKTLSYKWSNPAGLVEVKRGGGFITKTKRYLTKHMSRKAVTLSEELIPRNGKLKRIRARQNPPSSTSASLHFCLILFFCRLIFSWLRHCHGGEWLSHIYTLQMQSFGEAARRSVPKADSTFPRERMNCSGFPQASTLCPISCQLEGRVVKNKYGLQGLTSPETVDSGWTGEGWRSCHGLSWYPKRYHIYFPKVCQKSNRENKTAFPRGRIWGFSQSCLFPCGHLFPWETSLDPSVIPHYDGSQMIHQPEYSPHLPLGLHDFARSPLKFVICLHN